MAGELPRRTFAISWSRMVNAMWRSVWRAGFLVSSCLALGCSADSVTDVPDASAPTDVVTTSTTETTTTTSTTSTTTTTTTTAAESPTDTLAPAPSQSPADAVRDGVLPGVAELSLAHRIEVLARVDEPDGVWVLSRIPRDSFDFATGGLIGDPTGTYPVDFIVADEYGEILRLDPSGRIVAAYPMPSAVPSWIVTTDDAVLAGRTGDGGLPDSTLVRIKRSSLSAEVVVIPAPFDGSTEWPPDWVTATSSQVNVYSESIGFASEGAQGTPATSWIGEVVVDIDRLNAIADAAFGQ